MREIIFKKKISFSVFKLLWKIVKTNIVAVYCEVYNNYESKMCNGLAQEKEK